MWKNRRFFQRDVENLVEFSTSLAFPQTGNQKLEIRNQKSEIRSWKLDVLHLYVKR